MSQHADPEPLFSWQVGKLQKLDLFFPTEEGIPRCLRHWQQLLSMQSEAQRCGNDAVDGKGPVVVESCGYTRIVSSLDRQNLHP